MSPLYKQEEIVRILDHLLENEQEVKVLSDVLVFDSGISHRSTPDRGLYPHTMGNNSED